MLPRQRPQHLHRFRNRKQHSAVGGIFSIFIGPVIIKDSSRYGAPTVCPAQGYRHELTGITQFKPCSLSGRGLAHLSE